MRLPHTSPPVASACWALVNHDERPEDLAPRLSMSRLPRTPAHHLSADLVLRYLPQVHRRARAIGGNQSQDELPLAIGMADRSGGRGLSAIEERLKGDDRAGERLTIQRHAA